jgi:Rrf2 family iron-sulfur cluster assembly transcriptional regulator
MYLTAKGRYAVTALLDLVLHEKKAPFALSEISKRNHIPLPYLERLAGQLRAKGLLISIRGPGGGYILGQPPDKITIADIVLAIEEPIDTTKCGGKGNCANGHVCLTHALWDQLNDKIFEFLQNITLKKLSEWPQIQKIVQLHDSAPRTACTITVETHTS